MHQHVLEAVSSFVRSVPGASFIVLDPSAVVLTGSGLQALGFRPVRANALISLPLVAEPFVSVPPDLPGPPDPPVGRADHAAGGVVTVASPIGLRNVSAHPEESEALSCEIVRIVDESIPAGREGARAVFHLRNTCTTTAGLGRHGLPDDVVVNM